LSPATSDLSGRRPFTPNRTASVFSPEVAGSLQYAASHLATPLFVVLGHEGCGAVQAALESKYENTQHGTRIQILVNSILPALTMLDPGLSGSEMLSKAIENNVRWTVQQILNTPEGQARIAEGQMKIIGAIYEIQSGRVRFLRGQ
jgi:carbonic anhydrase